MMMNDRNNLKERRWMIFHFSRSLPLDRQRERYVCACSLISSSSSFLINSIQLIRMHLFLLPIPNGDALLFLPLKTCLAFFSRHIWSRDQRIETRCSSSRSSPSLYLIGIRCFVVVTSSLQRSRTNARWNQSLDQIHSNVTAAATITRRCRSIHSTMPSLSLSLSIRNLSEEEYALL